MSDREPQVPGSTTGESTLAELRSTWEKWQAPQLYSLAAGPKQKNLLAQYPEWPAIADLACQLFGHDHFSADTWDRLIGRLRSSEQDHAELRLGQVVQFLRAQLDAERTKVQSQCSLGQQSTGQQAPRLLSRPLSEVMIRLADIDLRPILQAAESLLRTARQLALWQSKDGGLGAGGSALFFRFREQLGAVRQACAKAGLESCRPWFHTDDDAGKERFVTLASLYELAEQSDGVEPSTVVDRVEVVIEKLRETIGQDAKKATAMTHARISTAELADVIDAFVLLVDQYLQLRVEIIRKNEADGHLLSQPDPTFRARQEEFKDAGVALIRDGERIVTELARRSIDTGPVLHIIRRIHPEGGTKGARGEFERTCGNARVELETLALTVRHSHEAPRKTQEQGIVGESLTGPRKRSTEKGEALVKIIAVLTQHHQYYNGSCGRTEPIAANELARKAHVAKSTASKFFTTAFKGFDKYRAMCHRSVSDLVTALKMLNSEFSPHILYEAGEQQEDREDEE